MKKEMEVIVKCDNLDEAFYNAQKIQKLLTGNNPKDNSAIGVDYKEGYVKIVIFDKPTVAAISDKRPILFSR